MFHFQPGYLFFGPPDGTISGLSIYDQCRKIKATRLYLDSVKRSKTKSLILFICSYLLLSFHFTRISHAGYTVSNTENKAFEQGWLIPICDYGDDSYENNVCGPSGSCSISKPSKEQLDELLVTCQSETNNDTSLGLRNNCYNGLDALVNLSACNNKNLVVTTMKNGKTIAHYRTTSETIVLTPTPPIYTILTPKVKKPLVTPTKIPQPTVSINPALTSTPSATQLPDQIMPRSEIINEIVRLIKLLISSLFKKYP